MIAVTVLGIDMALETKQIIIIVASIAFGGMLGKNGRLRER